MSGLGYEVATERLIVIRASDARHDLLTTAQLNAIRALLMASQVCA
jgi:hypothetical protein